MRDLGNRKAYFVSDIHLQRNWGRNGEDLLRFFDHVAAQGESFSLFLVGDIFDVWVSDHKFFVKSFRPFVDRLSLLASRGDVFYFEGNHDFHIRRFWQDRLGIEVIENFQSFQIQGKKVRVEHGDFINPEDTAYLKWRETARGPLFTFLAHAIPGRGWQFVADVWINNNKRIRKRNPLDQAEEVRKKIRTYAEKVSGEEDYDYLITGHMHVRDEYVFQGRESVNLGTWLDSPSYYLLEAGKGRFIESW